MNTKNIIIAIIVLAAIGGGVYYFKNNPTNTEIDTQPTTSASHETTSPNAGGSTGTTSGEKSYTLVEVQAHNSRSSCWTVINGNVYDVTAWINQHPGGAEAILSLCGKDGTSAFEGQHDGQPRPEQELAGFQIGALLMGL